MTADTRVFKKPKMERVCKECNGEYRTYQRNSLFCCDICRWRNKNRQRLAALAKVRAMSTEQ